MPNAETARTFTVKDQAKFAGLSGDRNPMHVDPLAARRTQAGGLVVHGIHAVLWSLDMLAAAGDLQRPFSYVTVAFRRFVYVDAPCHFTVIHGESGIVVRITSDGLRCIDIHLHEVGPSYSESTSLELSPWLAVGAAVDVDFNAISDTRGRFALPDAALAGSEFQALAQVIGPSRVAALAALSTLVGMVCPGLHSIFDGFNVELAGIEHGAKGLAYAITDIDDRFRRISMDIAGGGIRGTVNAFVRHLPVVQPSYADARDLVPANAFDGVSALIVGGSRGIGAATARLLAAGGARIVVTYRSGKREAQELVDEIGQERCHAVPYDTALDVEEQLASLPCSVDQAYYFPTPQIVRDQALTFSADRFAEMCRVYIDGFERLVRALSTSRGRLTMFYPSSAAVTERPLKMTEYAMAKAAGEILCADLQRSLKTTKIVVSRLPRILTDQTSSVTPVKSADVFAVMLPIVFQVAALTETSSDTR